ncbi:hypothetical protein [Aquimarina longa]|uniref:hypothetical protein n=1 Tax=Aquimarina longa TaxID=1080221 RepID=UPI0007866C92|nr:hypothetical protein [Aquimarina longa]
MLKLQHDRHNFSHLIKDRETTPKKKLLNHNPCEDIEYIDQQETEREFLILEELKASPKPFPIL